MTRLTDEQMRINLSDNVFMGNVDVHQNIVPLGECPSCSASNVKVMKCQDKQCGSKNFCELCHTNSRFSEGLFKRFDSGIGSGPFCAKCLKITKNQYEVQKRLKRERVNLEREERERVEVEREREKRAERERAEREREERERKDSERIERKRAEESQRVRTYRKRLRRDRVLADILRVEKIFLLIIVFVGFPLGIYVFDYGLVSAFWVIVISLLIKFIFWQNRELMVSNILKNDRNKRRKRNSRPKKSRKSKKRKR